MEQKKTKDKKFKVELKEQFKRPLDYELEDLIEFFKNVVTGRFRDEQKRRKYNNLNALFVGLGIAGVIVISQALFSLIKFLFTREKVFAIDMFSYFSVGVLFFIILLYIEKKIVENTYIEKKE
ncbi:MAG: hypothetical protein ACLFN8_04625 [Candidatus Woesearchaeota archaeon]